MCPQRLILRMISSKEGQHWSNDQVLVMSGQLSIEARLAHARLKYFIRFARHGSDQLLTLVLVVGGVPGTWLGQVIQHLDKLR
eukprot:15437367-Alexandrium_andersonii.AAC.1